MEVIVHRDWSEEMGDDQEIEKKHKNQYIVQEKCLKCSHCA